MTLLRELYQYREMIRSLVHRDLRGRYKGSMLGFLWTFINPLMQLIVYTVVFSNIMRMGIDDYYLFLFVALIPWMFFSTSITNGSSCIWVNQNLVTKIYFPREVLPLSVVTANFINMLYCLVIVFAVVLLMGKPINYEAWLYLPLVFGIEYILTLGFTLIFSACMVYLRDLEHILGIVAMAWQFLCPIMYPVSMVPDYFFPYYNFNPMTPIIIAIRDILYDGRVPDLMTLGMAAVYGVVFLLIGIFSFGKLKKGFAEEL